MENKFYSVFPSLTKKWFLGRVSEEDVSTVDRWIIDKAMRGFKGIVHVEITRGNTPGDFLEVAFPLLIVSSKVLEIWKKFEKFQTYRVIVQNRKIPFEYLGVVFLGRGGPLDPVKSKAVYSNSLNKKGKRAIIKQEGMYFDDSQWDGSDLLTIDEFPCVPIVTERVFKEMKKARVTNCRYTPLEKYGIYQLMLT